MPKSDPVRERITAFNQARGGGVLVHKAGHGYSLLSERTGAPIARLRPTGDADKVQVQDMVQEGRTGLWQDSR